MIPSLIIGLLIVGPAFAQDVSPLAGEITTFNDLSAHIEALTNGGVRPAKDSYLSFRVNHKTREATPILSEANPDLIHSLFETDVQRMIQNAGTPDFVSAKKKYYKAQSFNTRTQQYSRSYIYPSDWHSLNHNPVRKFNLSPDVYGPQFVPLEDKTIAQSPLLEADLHRKLDEVTGTEMTAGNKMRLLNNGEVSFKEKVRMVKEAKHFFHSVVMVQYCDESSNEIVDAMINKAQQGVDVRLMVEGVWTKLVLKKCLKKLRSGGVKVVLGKGFFNPRTMFTVHHTKFWIRDGEEAIIGGQNMHDFENRSNGFNNHTRDKDVHVTGPAVTDLMSNYIRIWNHEKRYQDRDMEPYKAQVAKKEAFERAQGLRGKDLYEQWLNRDISEIPGVCRVLVQGTKTTTTPNIISKAYIEIMKNVKFNMLINSPTFRYNEDNSNAYSNSQIIRSIIEGASRGVKIDLVSNGVDGGWGEAGHQLRLFGRDLRRKGQTELAVLIEKMDKTFAIFVGRSNRKHLSKVINGPNVDVWLYFNHIHSKQMMFDNILTSTGSFNLDKYSHRNNESTMICLDKKLADESLTGFVSDVVNAVPVI